RDGPDGAERAAGGSRAPPRPPGGRDLQRGGRAQPLRRGRTPARRLTRIPGDSEAELDVLVELLAEPDAPVSVPSARQARDVHIADSLSGLELAELRSARRLADLGSGAGLPGLVLATKLPDARVDLIESIGRKCRFIAAAIERLGLENAEVVCERSE